MRALGFVLLAVLGLTGAASADMEPDGSGYDYPAGPAHPTLPEEGDASAVDTRGTEWGRRQQQEALRQTEMTVQTKVDTQARTQALERRPLQIKSDLIEDLKRRAAIKESMVTADSLEALKEWSNKQFSEGPGADALKPPPVAPQEDRIFKGTFSDDLKKRKEKGVRIYVDPADLAAVMAKSEAGALEMLESMDRELVAGGDALSTVRNLKRRVTSALSTGKITAKLGFQKMPWSGVNETLVAVSLRNLMAAPLKGGAMPDDAATVGRLKRVLGYMLDTATDDVVLIGVPGDKDDQPSLILDDLTNALQTAWVQDLKPGCSLDPDPNDPGGKQKVRVFGVPKNSNFAKIMLDADYEMKKINMGLIKFDSDPIPGFASNFDLQMKRLKENPAEKREHMNSRFWLTPMRPEPGDMMVEPGRRFMMFQTRVSLMTEAMTVSGDALIGTGKVDPVDDVASRVFTAHYESIEQRRVVFRRLHALFDLVMLAQIFRENGVRSKLLERIAARATRPVDVPDAYDGVRREEVVSGTNIKWTVQGGVMVYLKLRRKYFRDLEQKDLLELESSIMDAMCGRSVSISDSSALKQLLKDRLRVEKEKRDADLLFERGCGKSMQAESETQKGTTAARPLFEEAERFFTKAIERDSDFPEACCQRAIARWRLKKYPEAIADCDLAMKKDPDLWTSYWIRSKIKRETGDRDGADADWKKYVDLVQKDKFLKEMLSTRQPE